MKCPGFEHREHTADVLIVSYGRILEEAFEEAALGVYEVITDTTRVKPRMRYDIEIEGTDLENLLYKWIEELLINTDADGVVYSIFRVCRIDHDQEKAILLGSAWGEPFDPERHEERTIVKAVTYAQMEIKREGECWKTQFVVDI